MERYCLVLDLIDDPELIARYEMLHRNIWPDIQKSIVDSGILEMEIYRTGNRLVMIIEVNETFSFSRKAEMDQSNDRVMEWEKLMWRFQKPLPWASKEEKWVKTKRIFQLRDPQ